MPTLNFTYCGPAIRARKDRDGNWRGVKVEDVFGSFRLIRKSDEEMILGDGGGDKENVFIVRIPKEIAV